MSEASTDSVVCPEGETWTDRIYDIVSPVFRRRRFRRFVEMIQPKVSETILDVGGYPHTWESQPRCAERIDILNLYPLDSEPETHPHIQTVIGDGCDLKYDDDSYDVVFSNSVIEHLYDFEKQKRFADEMRRVGKRLWIQTPAREFPIEPHFMTVFLHWFPRSIQKRGIRYLSAWGWINRPTQEEVDSAVAEIRLLTFKEMQSLFPDCVILREKFCFVFTKSYCACRRSE